MSPTRRSPSVWYCLRSAFSPSARRCQGAARAEPDSAMPLLDGLRVIDAASFIAGPVATTILADLGADVIKVEPPDGDPYRHRTGGPGVPDSPYNYRWIVDKDRKSTRLNSSHSQISY